MYEVLTITHPGGRGDGHRSDCLWRPRHTRVFILGAFAACTNRDNVLVGARDDPFHGNRVAAAARPNDNPFRADVHLVELAECRAVLWHRRGSKPKVNTGSSPSTTIALVRSGRHGCFDRLVVDINGLVAGYNLRYVSAVPAEGSGHAVPVRGGAAIAVVVKATSYDNATGRPVHVPADPAELTDVTGVRTLRQVAGAGSFEGQSTIALGVRAQLPFRTFILTGPGTGSMLVVDVAHLW